MRLPAAARAQGFDDDTSFLNDVRPLILPEEKATFEKLADKADRLEHQLDGIAAAKVVHPDITYKVGRDGHLVTLAEQLSGEMRTRGDRCPTDSLGR